jgi:serine/threonine protein kinase
VQRPGTDEALLASAIASGVLTAEQAAEARRLRDAAAARGEHVSVLQVVASRVDPARREQLRRLYAGTPADDGPTLAGHTPPTGRVGSPLEPTRWDADAPPADTRRPTSRYADVLSPQQQGDRTYLSFGGGAAPASATAPAPVVVVGPLQPGAIVGGRYEVGGELGRGGMGAVYRARHLASGVEVALKLIPDELSSAEARARFLREGAVAASLAHPGIVRVHEAGELDGRPFVAYELIEGCRTLDQVLPGLSRAQRVACVRDAARALGHAHARGVAHRDVKPQNLLVDAQGRVKVADFGLALAVDHDRLTRTGVQLGTPAFMAPEQIDAARDAQGPWTDVWALGVLLYEALCGQRPFQAPTFATLCVQIAKAAPTPPRALDATIPEALETIVLRALQAEPAGRPKDGEALAQALDQALGARPSVSAPAPAQGSGPRVGPFEVVRELGRGAVGVVYEARRADGRRVALKVLQPGGEGDDRVERFLVEARATARLRHPSIVSVEESGQDGGRFWLAMELVSGETLQARIARQGPLDEREAATVALALAQALDHAHGRSVLHRDVKPHNVLVAADDRPRLVDFGIAKLVGDGTLTGTGAMLGTPGYMPPEQVERRGAIDGRADVYALGATLFHMLTGRPPFGGATLAQVVMAVLKAPPPTPSALRAGLSPALDAIVLACLAKDRDRRYASAAALAADLEAYLAGRAPALPQPPPPLAPTVDVAGPTPPPPARRRLAHALAGAALVSLTVAGAWAATRPTPLAPAAAVAPVDTSPTAAPVVDDARAAEVERAREAEREAEQRARLAEARLRAAEEARTREEDRKAAPGDDDEARQEVADARRKRELRELRLPVWVSRRAAARAWGDAAYQWGWRLKSASAEAQTRRVPLVFVLLAPDQRQLPAPLRDPALTAELNRAAVPVLSQVRDKTFHDEVVDRRALDHGDWPGRNDQVCPIARTAPCEVHDAMAEDLAGSLPPLQPGEAWRVLVVSPRGGAPTGVATSGGPAPPPELVLELTPEGLRAALEAARRGLGEPLALDEVLAAYDALRVADEDPTSSAALDAIARYRDPERCAGLFTRWAERVGE